MLEFDAPGLPIFFSDHSTEDMRPLPRRIIALIGRNGSGKSTLLSRIARVAFSSPSDRMQPEIQALGAFEPGSIGFIKIIAISYSAFDNFIVPGLDESERRQIADDIEKGGGRYIYAGLRDIVAEVRDDLAAAEDRQLSDDEPAQPAADDLRTATRLKSLVQLAEEFQRLIDQIAANDDNELLDAALVPLFADPSFADIEKSDAHRTLGFRSSRSISQLEHRPQDRSSRDRLVSRSYDAQVAYSVRRTGNAFASSADRRADACIQNCP